MPGTVLSVSFTKAHLILLLTFLIRLEANIMFLILQMRKLSTERVSDLLQVTQPVSDRVGI